MAWEAESTRQNTSDDLQAYGGETAFGMQICEVKIKNHLETNTTKPKLSALDPNQLDFGDMLLLHHILCA